MQQAYRLQADEAWVTIPSNIGPLQGLSKQLQPNTPVPCLAIVCHPHPCHEGTMFNKVVTSAAQACAACHIPSIRFNHRGIGQSAGHYSALPDACQDLDAVYAWAMATHQPQHIWWLGFSFGGYVATYGAGRYGGEGLITMAPSMARMPFDALPYPACPWWIVQGESDAVVEPQAVYDWSAQHPNTLIRMPDCGHFFHGQLVSLKTILTDIISDAQHG